MKLELKHLAPYLPYGLKCHASGECVEGTEYDENPKPLVFTIVGTSYNWIEVEGKLKTLSEQIVISDCFPILRPLSDLTKEIEVNGEKFVPLDTLNDGNYGHVYIDIQYGIRFDVYKGMDVPDLISLTSLLFQWHFDVFGLIPAGLAIDINTIKQKSRST